MTPAEAGVDELTGAVEALAARLDAPPRSILYLTRSDLEPGRALAARFPGARTVTRSKADFQGRGPLAILGMLRRERYDLFVLHDRPGEMTRLADLYRLAAIGVRADRRFLLAADLSRGRLEAGWSLEEVLPGPELPKLMGRLLAEGAAAVPVLAGTPLALAMSPPGGRRGAFRKKTAYSIAYLRTDYSFGIRAGGSVSHMSGVVGGLVDAGHRVFFISSDRVPDVDESRTPVTVIEPGRAIRIFDEAAMAAYHHRFVREAGRIIAEQKPDILYQRHSVFNAAGACLARRFGIPLILEANHSEVEARAMWSRLTLRGLARRMERHAFAGADVVVAVSAVGREALVRFGAAPERILVNPNGVDPERFRPDVDGRPVRERHGWVGDEIVCGFLGTFTRWHGVLFLVDRVPELVRRHPRARFLFMGDGDLRSAAEDALERAGVSKVCAFTGMIDHHQVPAHLAACDVLISPHLPFEDGTPFFGSPTKLFEYLAMGRAVVASNLGQIGEVIEDEKSGMLYAPGSEAGFDQAMARVLEDGELRARLGREARERVVSRYSWRRNAERALEFLEERLGAGGSGRLPGADVAEAAPSGAGH